MSAETPNIGKLAEEAITNVEKVIVGKSDVIKMALAAILAGGHILIEDVPGVGKTILCRAIARSFNCSFQRVQFTPDLLPSDITGLTIYNLKSQQFEFKPGPVFTNFLLADEINRATPKTQSALLEAMGERQVTVDGVTYPLEAPFLVMATQNPIEYEGTFPLPEAQLDRFIIKMRIGYPGEEAERAMLARIKVSHPIENLSPVLNKEDLIYCQKEVRQTLVDETIYRYIVDFISRSRLHEDVYLGPSPRGSIALLHLSQAWARSSGRNYVLPDDVKAVAPFALSHRIILKTEARLRGQSPEAVIANLIETTPLSLQD